MTGLHKFAPLAAVFVQETDIEHEAISLLRQFGFIVKTRKSGNKLIDSNWPSVTSPRSSKKLPGKPDLLIFLKGAKTPFCVWDNKARTEAARCGLEQSKTYIQGLHTRLPNKPNLPRLASGFNGEELLLSYYMGHGPTPWVDLKAQGRVIINEFPDEELLQNGISSKGILTSLSGSATVNDLRKALWDLKTRYRVIPPLASARTPIDFTVALLTLRVLVEQNPDWGTWAEQPLLQEGEDREKQIAERLNTLSNRVLNDRELHERYGDIFKFQEMEGSSEVAFDFIKILNGIDKDTDHFETLFHIVDELPPLISANFDLFGEVYQYIGDDATKKALGEFFTGRHIISGTVPVLFARAGLDKSITAVQSKKLADIACGTGGFLTESLRWFRHIYALNPKNIRAFAKKCFYGYDLGHANASRARVNMYFAGDGFSVVAGGIDSLSDPFLTKHLPRGGFDVIMTNPPYGKSKYGLSEEVFLNRVIESLRIGTGWGLIVLPTGVLENPRSSSTRFRLLKQAIVTDVIALPKHAFAPYTQQRTAIVIFNKRGKPLPIEDGDWQALLKHIRHERISFYIVDNDGYANSDKRYPTSRRAADGRWLHNELAPWTDNNGIAHPSSLFDALVNQIAPYYVEDEFGSATGQKYVKMEMGKLTSDNRPDVRLLPDVHLRRLLKSIAADDYLREAKLLIDILLRRETTSPVPNLRNKIRELVATPITYPSTIPTERRTLKELFPKMSKGDQGFTEEIIYNHHDPQGLPVYGGGAEPPRFRVKDMTITKSGRPITVHEGPAIIVSMDGTSGSMRVVDKGKFCLNHHGCVLTSPDTSIDLQWIAQQSERGLRQLASNQKGSATLTVEALGNFTLDVPIERSICSKIGKLRANLLSLYSDFYE